MGAQTVSSCSLDYDVLEKSTDTKKYESSRKDESSECFRRSKQTSLQRAQENLPLRQQRLASNGEEQRGPTEWWW